MMLKIRQVFIFQQNPKHPGLVSRFLQGYQVVNLKEDHQPFENLINSSEHPSLKLEKCWKYLEPQSGLSGPMQNSFAQSCPHQGHPPYPSSSSYKKGMVGEFSYTEGSKSLEDLENWLMSIVLIDLAQQNCDNSAKDNQKLWLSKVLD
jgi:hypothetical protein